MTDKQGAQTSLGVEIDFKWKDAEDQIDEMRHSRDASAVPGPYLGTDVINDLLPWCFPSQCPCKTQIETWVIDQDDSVRFTLPNFVDRFVKLFSEIAIFPQHFP